MHRTPTLPLPHIQLNQYQLDLVSGLAFHHSARLLTSFWKTSYWVFNSHAIDNEHSALVPWTYNLFDCRQLLPLTSGLVASMSGLAFISPLCIHASPLYFGGLDYRPHGSLATVATRTSVLLSYTLRPSNRHYFPSKSFSPSSQYTTLEKKNFTAVFMAIELSYEAAASTNTQRTPCFRCFLQDVRLTSIRE